MDKLAAEGVKLDKYYVQQVTIASFERVGEGGPDQQKV